VRRPTMIPFRNFPLCAPVLTARVCAFELREGFRKGRTARIGPWSRGAMLIRRTADEHGT